MSFHRPIAPARTQPERLVGEFVLFAPPHGGLSWRARLALIAAISVLLWGALLLLIGVVAG